MAGVIFRRELAAKDFCYQYVCVSVSDLDECCPPRVFVGTRTSHFAAFTGAHFSTAQARKLARWLLKAADKAEASSD